MALFKNKKIKYNHSIYLLSFFLFMSCSFNKAVESSNYAFRTIQSQELDCNEMVSKLLSDLDLSNYFTDPFSRSTLPILYSYRKIFKQREAELINIRINKLDFENNPAVKELNSQMESLEREVNVHLRKHVELNDFDNVNSDSLFWKGSRFEKVTGILGIQNKGIYRSSENNQIIKIISNDVFSILNELFFSVHVEEVGGPKLFHIGRTRDNSYYLVMEDVSALGSTMPMKQLVIDTYGKYFLPKFYSPKFRENLINELGNHFEKVIEKKIFPKDPDFMVSSTGGLRWIDVGFWSLVKSRSDIISLMDDYLRGLEKKFGAGFSNSVMVKTFEKLERNQQISKLELREIKKHYSNCPCSRYEVELEI